ncbi:MAG: homoserine dehydrogenase, partial [Candidatus Hodarchaeota archaeon]
MITRIAFIGFGVVGQGFAEILIEQKADLKDQFGFEFEVVAVADKMKGSVYAEDGLDLQKLLDIV